MTLTEIQSVARANADAVFAYHANDVAHGVDVWRANVQDTLQEQGATWVEIEAGDREFMAEVAKELDRRAAEITVLVEAHADEATGVCSTPRLVTLRRAKLQDALDARGLDAASVASALATYDVAVTARLAQREQYRYSVIAVEKAARAIVRYVRRSGIPVTDLVDQAAFMNLPTVAALNNVEFKGAQMRAFVVLCK